jgi:hypothetical protein
LEAVDLRVLGEVRTADSVVTAAARLARQVEADTLGRVSHHVGDVALALGYADSAASAYVRAVAAAERAGDDYRLRRALERGLVPALAEAGRAGEARVALRRLERQPIPLERALRRTLEARIAEAAGDTARAYRHYVAALADDDYPDDGTHLPLWHHIAFRAARAALVVGDARAADTLARRAVRLGRALHQDDSTSADIGQALVVLARARLALADTAGARATLRRAMPALAHGLGPDHPRTREAYRLAVGDRRAAPTPCARCAPGARAQAPPPVRSDSSGASGSHTTKEEPTPTVLSTLISPPMRRASRRLIVSPRPAPPTGLLLRRPTCTNGSKIASSCSAGIPGPVSSTRT